MLSEKLKVILSHSVYLLLTSMYNITQINDSLDNYRERAQTFTRIFRWKQQKKVTHYFKSDHSFPTWY